MRIPLTDGDLVFSSVNTGVPHTIIEAEDIAGVDVVKKGREIRYHDHFAPKGTNVNFISMLGKNKIAIRTYERGVEEETLACGTGSVACALVAALKRGLTSPVTVLTQSRIELAVHFRKVDKGFEDVYLEGDARLIYKGQLCADSWNG